MENIVLDSITIVVDSLAMVAALVPKKSILIHLLQNL